VQNYQPAKLLRLHFTERDRYRGKPLYQAVVEKCQEMKIAGATVFRGLEGFGGTAEVHRSHILAHDLPIVIQIVDTEERIRGLLPIVEEMMDKGLIAMSDVSMVRIQKTAKAHNV
jgi:PII-like signaling protein